MKRESGEAGTDAAGRVLRGGYGGVENAVAERGKPQATPHRRTAPRRPTAKPCTGMEDGEASASRAASPSRFRIIGLDVPSGQAERSRRSVRRLRPAVIDSASSDPPHPFPPSPSPPYPSPPHPSRPTRSAVSGLAASNVAAVARSVLPWRSWTRHTPSSFREK